MNRNRLMLFLGIVAATALWSIGWARNSGHLFGDPLLAGEMYAAGERLALHPLATAGLPVYRPGAAPYTHLTPGPEWIQAAIALLRLPFVPLFAWHSIATSALSVLVLWWISRSTRRVLVALEIRDAAGAAWAAALLIGATPAFLIYAPHPYCLGTLLGNAVALAFVSSWAREPVESRRTAALTAGALAFFALFWLGTAPVVSGAIWMLGGFVVFGERAGRRGRAMAFVVTIALVGLICGTLKLTQSVAVLGSWEAAIADARTILARRAGASATLHLLRDTMMFRIVFLFGLAVIMLAVLAWRTRKSMVGRWPLPLTFLAGGFAWQVVMRGHAAYHVYMLRELMVPLVLTLAVVSGHRDSKRHLGWMDGATLVQLILVLAVLLIPLVVTGEPLWRLLR